jgi:hypothetical protein
MAMQIAAGSWILDAMKEAPAKPAVSRIDRAAPVKQLPRAWTPPSAQGRGLLIDLIV